MLDFANDYKDITAAFSKYYTKTMLSNSVTPAAIYDSIAKIEGYFFLDPMDVEAFNKLLYESEHTSKDKKQMTFYLQKAKRVIDGFTDEDRNQCAMDIRHFIRFYEFLLQLVLYGRMVFIMNLIFWRVATGSPYRKQWS